MTRKLLSQSEFHDAVRAGRAAATPVERAATVQRVATDGSRIVRWTLSDQSVDRIGDTIDPNGWDLTAYKENPVILWSHDSSAPPIGRMHGPWVINGQLVGDIEFADASTYAFADDVFRLVQGGFIKAGSVGFLPTEYRFSGDKNRPGGIDFIRQELLEFSITPVPANANALVQAQAKGLNAGVLRGTRSGGASPRIVAELRSWARETAQSDPDEDSRMARARNMHHGLSKTPPLVVSPEPTEAEMMEKAKRLARDHLGRTADRSTPEGRAQHAQRLKAFHANGGKLVDPRAVVAEAAFRTTPRW